MNKLIIEAEVSSVAALRYTPAGIAVLSLTLSHLSEQLEAEMSRVVACTIKARLLGQVALQGVTVGQRVRVTGFLAHPSLKSKHLVLHVQSMQCLI